jgi:hypothetical protein
MPEKDIIKSTIMAIKILTIFARIHNNDYKVETLIIMTYVQVSLILDDKSDLEYT